MSSRKSRKRGRPMQSHRVWIQPEMNDDLDARKLSRAFLALALHRAAEEVAAETEHDHGGDPGHGDDRDGA